MEALVRNTDYRVYRRIVVGEGDRLDGLELALSGPS